MPYFVVNSVGQTSPKKFAVYRLNDRGDMLVKWASFQRGAGIEGDIMPLYFRPKIIKNPINFLHTKLKPVPFDVMWKLKQEGDVDNDGNDQANTTVDLAGWDSDQE